MSRRRKVFSFGFILIDSRKRNRKFRIWQIWPRSVLWSSEVNAFCISAAVVIDRVPELGRNSYSLPPPRKAGEFASDHSCASVDRVPKVAIVSGHGTGCLSVTKTSAEKRR